MTKTSADEDLALAGLARADDPVTTNANVTVTVVADGVITTYEIKAETFETGTEYEYPEAHETLAYGPLESSAIPRIKALTFSMRPVQNGTTYGSIHTMPERT